MADGGKLIYKSGSGSGAGSLAYKAGSGALAYKVDVGGVTEISFAWGSDGDDLDICAYWDGASSMKMGFQYNTSTAEQTSGVYKILYSGDIRGYDNSEWLKIWKTDWSQGSRTFRVHFNYWGYSSAHPANTCSVIAAQADGKTLVVNNVPCSTNALNPATTSSPGVVISFDASGHLESITTI